MTFAIQTGAPCDIPGATVVQASSGELIAVECHIERSRSDNAHVVCTSATWIDAKGAPKVDAQGNPVSTHHRHACSAAEIAANTRAKIIRACAMLVLGGTLPALVDAGGEAVTLFSAQTVADKSVMDAIQTAQATLAPVDLGAMFGADKAA